MITLHSQSDHRNNMEPPIISYRKGAFTQRHTRKSKIIIAKARKPNHVFRSHVGLSAHINTSAGMIIMS